MKEDILEQLADDYLQSQGYVTRHNIKFRPSSSHPDFERTQDSNHSDIDVIGVNPRLSGTARVWVVSCKRWQSGFDAGAKLREINDKKIISGRGAWRFFRELVEPKWSEAFVNEIHNHTGQSEFTYFLAVTSLRGDRNLWEEHEEFRRALAGNPLQFLRLEDMVCRVQEQMTTTPVASQLGRTLQLLRAAGADWKWSSSEPSAIPASSLAAGGGRKNRR